MRSSLLFLHVSALTLFACAGGTAPPTEAPASPPAVHVATSAVPPAASSTDPFAYDAKLPLDVRKDETVAALSPRVQSLSYASPRGGRVPALFVSPAENAKHPVVIFQHQGKEDKSEFQDEAEELAKSGIASLLIDGPWLRPENRGKSLARDWPELIRHGAVDVLRSIDVLASLPNVDPERIAFVGHSYGANLGAVVAAREARVKAVVLMAGVPNWGRLIRNAEAEPLAAERFIEESRTAVFEQFGAHDELISVEAADAYFERTPPPRVMRIYETDHGMKNPVARQDRREFLQHIFSLEPGTRASELSKIPGYFMTRLPVAYSVPPASSFEQLPEQTYRTVSGQDYRLDTYRPKGASARRPAVIFVHGQMHPALLREAKSWRGYQDLAKILAAKGYVSIVPNLGATPTGPGPKNMFTHVESVADNLDQAVQYVRTNAAKLGVDPKRIGLWVASAGGSYGLGSGLRNAAGSSAQSVRAVVAFYPLITESSLTATEPSLPEATIERLSAARQLRRHRGRTAPVLLVRAGYDRPSLNQGIDDFVKLGAELKAPVTLLRHDRGHHGFELIDATDETSSVLDRTFAFLDAQLGPKAPKTKPAGAKE